MNPASARTALVLSGGGAYGAFGVGVMKVLFAGRSPATAYQPLCPDIFSGTSVGALNASIIVSEARESYLAAVSRLEQIWLDSIADRPGGCGNGILRFRANPADLVDLNCLANPVTLARHIADDALSLSTYLLSRTANFLASSAALEDRVMALVNIGDFVDTSPYYALLRNLIDEQKVRESSLHLVITTTDWAAGRVRYFYNADFHDGLGIHSIMASTAIPGIFPPVRIGRDIYVDGGVVENTPLNSAIRAGAAELHVIYLDPKPSLIPLMGEAHTFNTMLRVYYIMLATKMDEDIETARWINAGLDVVTNFEKHQTVSNSAARDFIRVAGKLVAGDITKYQRLRIHRYFPEKMLGGNLGMLDFDVDSIAELVREGERVALVHDCEENGCVL